MMSYNCSCVRWDEHWQRMYDPRPLDRFYRTFDFRLVPKGKVDQPDEDQHARKHSVKVRASGHQWNEISRSYSEFTDAEPLVAFWFVRNAIKRGDMSTELELDLGEHRERINLSRVEIHQPFKVELPVPKMGFHAER